MMFFGIAHSSSNAPTIDLQVGIVTVVSCWWLFLDVDRHSLYSRLLSSSMLAYFCLLYHSRLQNQNGKRFRSVTRKLRACKPMAFFCRLQGQMWYGFEILLTDCDVLFSLSLVKFHILLLWNDFWLNCYGSEQCLLLISCVPCRVCTVCELWVFVCVQLWWWYGVLIFGLFTIRFVQHNCCCGECSCNVVCLSSLFWSASQPHSCYSILYPSL